MGRFSQKDILRGGLEKPLSLPRYLYAYNNPINYVDMDGLVSVLQAARNGQLSGPKPVIEVFSGGNLVDTIVGTDKGAQVKARSVTKTVVANTAAQLASAAAAANDAKSVEAAFDYFKKNYANLPAEYKKIYDEAMKDIDALNKASGDYGKIIQIMLGACAKIGEAAKKKKEEERRIEDANATALIEQLITNNVNDAVDHLLELQLQSIWNTSLGGYGTGYDAQKLLWFYEQVAKGGLWITRIQKDGLRHCQTCLFLKMTVRNNST